MTWQQTGSCSQRETHSSCHWLRLSTSDVPSLSMEHYANTDVFSRLEMTPSRAPALTNPGDVSYHETRGTIIDRQYWYISEPLQRRRPEAAFQAGNVTLPHLILLRNSPRLQRSTSSTYRYCTLIPRIRKFTLQVQGRFTVIANWHWYCINTTYHYATLLQRNFCCCQIMVLCN